LRSEIAGEQPTGVKDPGMDWLVEKINNKVRWSLEAMM
jgi:hypothetical protein